MFHDIPDSINAEMRRLEEIDARDRVDGTARLQRLRQVPPETGRFLCLLAASAPDGSSQWRRSGRPPRRRVRAPLVRL